MNDNGEWRIKYNNELYTLYKDSDIITYIKINRLRWAGHVIRLEKQNPARRVFAAVVEGRRQKGRPKLRWEDGVTGDAKKMGERHWRSTATNRDGWQRLLRKDLAQSEMLRQWLFLKYFYIHPTIFEKGNFLLKTAYQNAHKGKQCSGLEKHKLIRM
jgi:hypothetical protein